MLPLRLNTAADPVSSISITVAITVATPPTITTLMLLHRSPHHHDLQAVGFVYLKLARNEGTDPYNSPCITHSSSFHFFNSFIPNKPKYNSPCITHFSSFHLLNSFIPNKTKKGRFAEVACYEKPTLQTAALAASVCIGESVPQVGACQKGWFSLGGPPAQ